MKQHCGDSVVVAHPLFQEEGGGSIPTSPLQLRFGRIDKLLARQLVAKWHSRLPDITNWQTCQFCYGAEFGSRWFAAAMWGPPIAREFNGRGYVELRRFAITDAAPKNTASRMLGWMLREMRAHGFTKAISYQDTEVHTGAIYRGAGWTLAAMKKNIRTGWNTRDRPAMQTAADKIRWEYQLSAASAEKISMAVAPEPISTNNMELFAAPACASGSAGGAGDRP